jgi:hypothetical protein
MAKKIKRIYYLVATYPARFYPELDKKLEALIGESSGSGYGFGGRDMSWDFKNKTDAKKAEIKARRFKGVKTKIYEDKE